MKSFTEGGYTGRASIGDEEVAGIVRSPESFILGESICDPLQDAITSTEIACRTADGVTLLVLQDHLARLCKLQRKQLKED